MTEDRLHQIAQSRPAGKVLAPRREVHPREDDLRDAVADEAAHAVHDGPGGDRARRPATLWNDAERASVVAAVLHGEERAGAPLVRVGEVRRGLLGKRAVADERLRLAGEVEPSPRPRPQLLGVADDRAHLGHRGESGPVRVGRAARHDDPRVRILPCRSSDRATRRADGLRRDGAGIVDDEPIAPRRAGEGAHRFGLRGVQAAAMRDDAHCPAGRLLPHGPAQVAAPTGSRSHAPVAGSSVPDHSHSAGPVMTT